ncbi:hypothetical protein V2J82_05250 [Pseudomonas alliivorans]|nr:hypothetical protein [Pseudomonas alliivorans]
MTETTSSKVEKWSYPLKVGTAEATDPQQYYQALAKAKDGYYPLGANGLWHGGVHFDEATGLVGDLTEVRCIADGEVVAYRIDEAYPKSDYGSTQAVYSTGFVLVKHRLEVPSPPAPKAVPGAPPTPAAAPMPSLTFFSLYMHLLDWEGYKANPSLARPGFWGKGLYQVKANLNTKSLGLRVRSAESGQSAVLAVLPRGTTVVTKPAVATKKWLEIVSVTPEVAGLAPNTGWVFKGEMVHLGGDRYFIGEGAKDVPPNQANGANVRDATSNGLPIAFLPSGTQVKISDDQAEKKYRKLIEIVSGQSIPALRLDANGKVPGFVWLDDLEGKSQPHAPMGRVVAVEASFKVKAGEVLGHVGKYQNCSDSAPKNLLHIEVFSCENVSDFTEQSKSKAVGLAGLEKSLVKVHKDSKIITHTQNIGATNPPKASDPGKKTGHEMIIPVGFLESLPAEKRIKEAVKINGVTTTTYWWRLEGLLADKDGNAIEGWFAEPDIALSRHSPFEWEGVQFIEETVSNSDHLAAYFQELAVLNDEEKARFFPSVANSTNSPIKEHLYSIIDTDKDRKLSTLEIRNALSKPWFSQPISKLVTKYESEWMYKAEKWDSLDMLVGHTPSEPNTEWVAEKKRIEKLAWWESLTERAGFSADGKVWHMHCIDLISSFNRRKLCACNAVVTVTRWGKHYGPVVWGEGKLGDSPQWASIEAAGEVTAFEKKIISAMCENEGKINAVQSYDSEIITAGAMQKTINPQGAGEFPLQVKRFKELYPEEYAELFEAQGWHLDISDTETKMYYQHSDFSNGEKLDFSLLKSKLRIGCSESTYGKVVQCKPVAVMSCAVGSPSYVKLQITDFIARLRKVLLEKPSTYDFTVGDLFISALGRAAALDESVNRPANVVKNLKKALDKFFLQNPTVSKDITKWGNNHATYELQVANIYGPGRLGMTEPADRYNKLKVTLNV